MLKRTIALLLIVSAASGLFAGCAKTDDKKAADSEKAVSEKYARNVLAAPEYPEMIPYPDYSNFENSSEGEVDFDAYSKAYDEYLRSAKAVEAAAKGAKIADSFSLAMMREFLMNSGNGNITFSPVNIYMALAMLAETTDTNTRAQIFKLLGVNDIDSLRTNAKAVWNSAYSDDGLLTSIPGASVWLRNDAEYNDKTLKNLADYYYAGSFKGEMGSESYNEAFKAWLNDQTGGLLEDRVKSVDMQPNTVVALATTILFTGKWTAKFDKLRTFNEIFHGAVADADVPFMHSSSNDPIYGTDKFTATFKSFNNGGNMYFILPDEGVSINDILADDESMEFILNPTDYEKNSWTHMKVNLSLPKFDICSDIDLTEGLNNLGITDIFDSALADFSPLTDTKDILLSKATHAARVMIDEEGCKAAAYTIMMPCGAALHEYDEIDLTFDRPFIYLLTDKHGNLLFAGVVNEL